MELGSRVWAVHVARKEETKKQKARDPDISPLSGGATAVTIATKFGRFVDSRDVFTLAKFENKRFITVTLISG